MRQRTSADHIAAIAVASVVFASCGSGLAPTVTCEGVRQLHFGMSEAKVEGAIGKPVAENKAGPTAYVMDGDTMWDYTKFGAEGVHFRVYFKDGSLIRVAAYANHWWRNRATDLYSLAQDGPHETAAFSQYFTCR